MKIIDLLNKISNGEYPKEIKYGKYMYYRHPEGYFRSVIDSNWIGLFADIEDIEECLNDEVEIIEEDKKIEHIGKTYDITNFRNNYPEAAHLLKDTSDKLFEIIDEINKLKKK